MVRSALFWEITQHILVIIYRRFGTITRSHLQETLEHGVARLS